MEGGLQHLINRSQSMKQVEKETNTSIQAQFALLLAQKKSYSPYLHPDYLQILTPNWQPFQSGAYLFPLAPRSLAHLKLLEQPLLIQHFALVGAKTPLSVDYTALLNALSAKFHYIDLCLDTAAFPLPAGWKSQERVTYRLALPESPQLLRGAYSQHLKRILKKSSALSISKDVSIEAFMPFLRQHLSNKIKLPASFYNKAEELLRNPVLQWQICGAYSGASLVAACAIFCHGQQRYYQLAVNAPAAKELNAMHQLLDRLLVDWCGQEIIFDFEGSMIAGLQRFYGGFGAKPYIYTRVSYSKLPWPLSLWKHGIRSE
jgi:hypothetical protein